MHDTQKHGEHFQEPKKPADFREALHQTQGFPYVCIHWPHRPELYAYRVIPPEFILVEEDTVVWGHGHRPLIVRVVAVNGQVCVVAALEETQVEDWVWADHLHNGDF